MMFVPEAEVIKVDGKRIDFKVSASDEMEEIGNGTHERTVINLRSFNERLAKKSQRDARRRALGREPINQPESDMPR